MAWRGYRGIDFKWFHGKHNRRSARVQQLEAELTAKTEQIENFEGRQVNMPGDGRSESSLGDADAVARAETVKRAPAEAVMQHKQQMPH